MPLPLIIGAFALGTAVFGAKKGYDGYQKHSEADDIVKTAQGRYDRKKNIFDEREKETSVALEMLGKDELDIGKVIADFKKLADDLIKKLNSNSHKDLEINFPKHQLQKIENYSYTAIGVLGSVAGAGAAGAAAGFAVYGGVMALGAASTGTAISSLAGVAATNATLAAIGGGSLATGGLGMAGGTAILGGAIAAPVLAIAGWAYDSHGDEALKNARKADREVDAAVSKMTRAIEQLGRTKEYVSRVKNELSLINREFNKYFKKLKEIDDFIFSLSGRGLSQDQKQLETGKINDEAILVIENGFTLASIMVNLIMTPIFKTKKENEQTVKNKVGVPEMEKDEDGSFVINDAELEKGLANARDKSSGFKLAH